MITAIHEQLHVKVLVGAWSVIKTKYLSCNKLQSSKNSCQLQLLRHMPNKCSSTHMIVLNNGQINYIRRPMSINGDVCLRKPVSIKRFMGGLWIVDLFDECCLMHKLPSLYLDINIRPLETLWEEICFLV